MRHFLLVLTAISILTSCSTDSVGEGLEGADELEVGDLLGKEDSAGVPGLPVDGDYSASTVWDVVNQWEDTDTPAAREAGLAWGENSGLNWDEKYAAWIGSLERVPSTGYGDTFEITTPFGKNLPAPELDCADVSIMLRASFAAWYGLPFYMVANGRSGPIYFGHFGIRTDDGIWALVDSNGGRHPMPAFATAYRDYSDMAPSEYEANWPTDSRLRRRGVSSNDDQEFLGEGARTGTYLDEIHLNKRAGEFIRLLMVFTGSAHLADSRNTYNLVPEALRTGDTLLFRRARNGSGHTMVVMRVQDLGNGQLQAEDAYGNIPPTQPVWESPAATKRNFTNDEGGGPTMNSQGETYSHIGGGLKRWRVSKIVDGFWENTWMAADESSWINDRDYDRIAARPERFDQLLGEISAEDRRDLLLQIIEEKRNHLRSYPASCSAREKRERAFDDLYDLMWGEFATTPEMVDAQYRQFEDYVFAELDYLSSKTCCWNDSTALMYEIIMDYNEELQASACAEPVVFMARDGGDYAIFRDYAEMTGRGAAWVEWSAGEECPQAGVSNDTEAEHAWTPWCSLDSMPTPTPTPGCEEDALEDNDSIESATPLSVGTVDGATCGGDDDYYAISGDGSVISVDLVFQHSEGDLDMTLLSASGETLERSASTSDVEHVETPTTSGETYYVRVYGYNGAQGSYQLTLNTR